MQDDLLLIIVIILLFLVGLFPYLKNNINTIQNTTTITSTIMKEKTETYTLTVTHTLIKTITNTITATFTKTITATSTINHEELSKKYEILEYFPINKGHYTYYKIIDTKYEINATYLYVVQHSATTRAGQIFLVTFTKVAGQGKRLDSSLYGEPDYGGHGLLLFFSGCPVREEINFWFRLLKLPLDVKNGTTYTFGFTKYTLFTLPEASIKGRTYKDVIKIIIDNTYSGNSLLKGKGVYYFAKHIGLVGIVFNRTDGSRFEVEAIEWGIFKKTNTLQGVLTLDGFTPAGSSTKWSGFAVGLTTCDRFYGNPNPAYSRTNITGGFKLEFYGNISTIYYGADIAGGSNYEILSKELKESIISLSSLKSFSKNKLLLSLGLPPPIQIINKLRQDAKWNTLVKSLHKKAWLQIASYAATRPEYRYAIYESRTIAVKHPEVYLKADALFNKLLLSASGMWNYYMVRTDNLMEQKRLYNEILMKGGEKFTWSKFNISMHKPIWYHDLYNGTLAYYPFIDIRLLFMGAALKGIDWKAPPLSMAEFLYFKYKDKGYHPYLLMSSNGTGFVAFKGGNTYRLIDYKGREVSSPPSDIILIFNEDHVWYPLMGRDDRSLDPVLSELVAKYGSTHPYPSLTKDEQMIIKVLRNSTELHNKTELLWAIYFAGKLHISSWKFYSEIFSVLYREDASRGGFYSMHGPNIIIARNIYVARISNMLSPETAVMAAMARYIWSKGGLLDTIMNTWLGYFLHFTATLDNPRQGGLQLWFHSELFFVGMDDAMLTKAGNCVMMQTIMASVMDLASLPGLEVYVASFAHTIESGRKGGHAILALYWNNTYGLAENYIWRPGVNPLNIGGPIGFWSVNTKNTWIVLVEKPSFSTGKIRSNANYTRVASIIFHIKELAPHMHIAVFLNDVDAKWTTIDKFVQEYLYPNNIETFDI